LAAAFFQALSTIAEIKKAIATLPAPDQRELYRHLGARFGRNAAEMGVDKRQAVQSFLRRWTGAGTIPVTAEEESDARLARLHLV